MGQNSLPNKFSIIQTSLPMNRNRTRKAELFATVYLLTTIIIFSVTRRSKSDVVHLLTDSLMVSNDLTDVTLVSDDTERGLDWCDSGE